MLPVSLISTGLMHSRRAVFWIELLVIWSLRYCGRRWQGGFQPVVFSRLRHAWSLSESEKFVHLSLKNIGKFLPTRRHRQENLGLRLSAIKIRTSGQIINSRQTRRWPYSRNMTMSSVSGKTSRPDRSLQHPI